MSVQVHQLIIHELLKKAGSTEADTFLSQEQIPIDQKAQGLIEKLNDTFLLKESILNGLFSDMQPPSFPGYFKQATNNKLGKDAFNKFSCDTANLLKLAIRGVLGAKGGYLVYAHYAHLDDQYVGVFLVRDTDGLVFKRQPDNHSFTVNTVTYLNTEKLAMACLIDLKRYRKKEGRYLQVIKHAKTQKDISEYFLNWLHLERPESSGEFTRTFLDVVNDLPLPLDPESGRPIDEDVFRKEVYDYASSNPHKTINMRDLDSYFYGEEKTVQNYLQEHNITLDTEFRYNPGMLKELYKYQVRAEGISLGFSRGDYTTRKIVVEDNIVIIHSESLAERIKEIFNHD